MFILQFFEVYSKLIASLKFAMKKLSLLLAATLFLSACDFSFSTTPLSLPTPPPLSSPSFSSTSTPSPTPISPFPTSAVTPTTIPTGEPKGLLDSSVLSFADQLSLCVKYKSQFIHLLTGETLEKEILGIIAGKCNYIEQMPNGGKMECKYTENERKAVSQYYKDVEAAESFGTGTNVDLGSGKQKTTYTIDGKEVENPLQEAMNNGVCVISGY